MRSASSRLAVGFGGVLLAALLGGIALATPAAAAPPAKGPSLAALGTCSSTSASTSDPYGHSFSTRRFCGTATAPVYASTSTASRKGTLNAGNDWVLCYRTGSFDSSGPYGGSSFWYYTHGDSFNPSVAHNSWGFVPSSYLNASDPEITTGLPQCGFTSVPL